MSVKLADAIAYLSADRTQLNRDLDRAHKDTNSWVRNIGTGIQQGIGQAFTNLAVGGVQRVMGTLATGVRGLTSGMVGGNSEFEQYNNQFTVLLKNATLARQRMAELSEFGAKTPFDLGEVVQADIILQGFGLHAQEAAARFGKSGAEIRTIAGDVSSGTSASFEEISGYLGRFSSGATGEAIARFQELGIVTRRELAGMGVEFSKSGELVSPLDEAMTVLLEHLESKYGGMMEVQSQSLAGMQSNLRDWVGNASREMGRPIFDVVKNELRGLLEFLNQPAVQQAIMGLRDQFAMMATGAVAIIRGFGTAAKSLFRALFGDFETFAGNLEGNSGEWGKNVILQFARGMAAGATAVVKVLNKIAEVITYWLQPHSPPKLLPNLDKWGAGAMQAYMDGFAGAADFDLFNSLSNTIGGLFRSVAEEDDTGLIARIFGGKEAIAQAIADVRNLGGIGAETLQKLEGALGALPPVALDYVKAALSLQQANEAVTAAQEAVNRVTDEYADKLRPLNSELEAINRKRADMSDDKRIAALKEAIASGALSANEEELAQMEIRERELKKQIRATEDQRDLELDAANEKLDAAEAEQKAAQEAFDMQMAMIQAQQESNDLINEQIGLLNNLSNALGAVGDGLGKIGEGLGGGLFGGIPDIGDIGEIDIPGADDITSIWDGLDIDGLTTEIESAFVPLNEQAETLGENLQIIKDNLNWDGVKEGVGTVRDIILSIGSGIATFKLATTVMGIVGAIQALGASGSVLSGLVAAIGGVAGVLGLLVGVIVYVILHWDYLSEKVTQVGILIQNFGLTIEILKGDFINWLIESDSAIAQFLFNFFMKLGLAKATITTWLSTQKTAVTTWFTNLGESISEWLTTAAETVSTWLNDTAEKITGWITNVGDKIIDFKDRVLGGLRDGWQWVIDKLGEFKDSLMGLPGMLADMVIPDWLQMNSPPPLATALSMIREEMDALSGMALPAFGRGLDSLANPLGAGNATAVVGATPTLINVTFTGDMNFKDEGMIRTFMDYLQSLNDDLAFGQFQGATL